MTKRKERKLRDAGPDISSAEYTGHFFFSSLLVVFFFRGEGVVGVRWRDAKHTDVLVRSFSKDNANAAEIVSNQQLRNFLVHKKNNR